MKNTGLFGGFPSMTDEEKAEFQKIFSDYKLGNYIATQRLPNFLDELADKRMIICTLQQHEVIIPKGGTEKYRFVQEHIVPYAMEKGYIKKSRNKDYHYKTISFEELEKLETIKNQNNMKFTSKNILTEFPKAGITDSKLQGQFKTVQEMHEFYGEDNDITAAIDKFVANVNAACSTQKPSPKSPKVAKTKVIPKKAETKPKTCAEPKPKTRAERSRSKEKPADIATRVEKILPEVGFIKRFVGLDGKTARGCHEQALRILNALQKAIVEKVIRKTSPYATEIMAVQRNLIWIVENPQNIDKLEINEKYKEIAKSQKISSETVFTKAFIMIQGKTGVKEKAKALRERISKSDVRLVEIMKSLDDYIAGKTETPEIDAQTLAGLYGLAGIGFTPKAGDIVSSTDFLGAQFDTLQFTGKWKTLIGLPDANFRIMMFGKPGSGKSTLALDFAGYLSKTLGKKVLYIAGEEKFGYTLQEKIVRLNVANNNLLTTDKIPANFDRFDVAFFDSVNTLGLEPEQLRKLPKSLACVFVFQTTKEGLFRGSQEFSHDVDTVIKVENMKATTEKNRYGGEKTAVAVL